MKLPGLSVCLLAALLSAGAIPGSSWRCVAETTNAPPTTPLFPAAGAAPSHRKSRPVRTALSGAELYSIHCNRCHPERYPTERTAAQWKTILMHMRVRANLPAEQARTILKYLQDNSGR